MSLYKCLKLTGFDDIRHENAILRHLHIQTMILPRQARDKHREKHSKKNGIFS
jgi:hypothetical protein